MRQKDWKLSEITLFYENSTFKEIKSYFEEFQNQSKRYNGGYSSIFRNFKIHFKINRNVWGQVKMKEKRFLCCTKQAWFFNELLKLDNKHITDYETLA